MKPSYPPSHLYDLATREVIVRATLEQTGGPVVYHAQVCLIVACDTGDTAKPFGLLTSSSTIPLDYRPITAEHFDQIVSFRADERNKEEGIFAAQQPVACQRVLHRGGGELVDPHVLPVLLSFASVQTQLITEQRMIQLGRSETGINPDLLATFARRFSALVSRLVADCNKLSGLAW
jgi:hypothetical protein